MSLPTSVSAASSLALARQACERIKNLRKLPPKVAIILGSGLGGLAADVEHAATIPYTDIPGFPPTRAAGHAGNLILGSLSSVPVAMLQGRVHRYEGHSSEKVAFPVQCLAALGAKTLIVTNAAGALNPRFQPGDVMAIDAHIDWLWNGLHGTPENDDPGRPCPCAAAGLVLHAGPTYSPDLIERAARISLLNHRILHRGTYVSTLGPTYETRAEYRMFRWMGGDAVGMSTTSEVLAARKLGMTVLALSVITNVASTDAPQSTTHAEVVDVGQRAQPHLRILVHGLLKEIAGQLS